MTQVTVITIPIFQMKKQRQRESKELAQRHTTISDRANMDKNSSVQIMLNFLKSLWNFRFSWFWLSEFSVLYKEIEKNEPLGHDIRLAK